MSADHKNKDLFPCPEGYSHSITENKCVPIPKEDQGEFIMYEDVSKNEDTKYLCVYDPIDTGVTRNTLSFLSARSFGRRSGIWQQRFLDAYAANHKAEINGISKHYAEIPLLGHAGAGNQVYDRRTTEEILQPYGSVARPIDMYIPPMDTGKLIIDFTRLMILDTPFKDKKINRVFRYNNHVVHDKNRSIPKKKLRKARVFKGFNQLNFYVKYKLL